MAYRFKDGNLWRIKGEYPEVFRSWDKWYEIEVPVGTIFELVDFDFIPVEHSLYYRLRYKNKLWYIVDINLGNQDFCGDSKKKCDCVSKEYMLDRFSNFVAERVVSK